MKKRVLSLVLAVILVVTALPLAVLPIFAAAPVYKGDIYTADDYNALYVADGRLLMIDFYTLNSLWDPDGTKLAEVSTATALDPANRKSWFYQFSVSQTVNGDSHYYSLQYNIPYNCNNACANSTNGVCSASWHDPNGLNQKANFTVGAGYIALLNNLMPDNLLNFNNVPAHNDGFTYQLVFKPGVATGSKGFFRVNNVILYSWTDATNPFSLTAVAEANKTATTLSSSVGATKDAVHTLNYMKAPVEAEAGTHTYSAAFDLGAASTATIATPAVAANTTHIGYSSTADMSLYAIRSYDRELTDAERLQNHIADLFKYYKIDITLYKELSDTDKAAVQESVKSFALPATDDVDAIKQTKADLQAAVNAAAQPLYYRTPVNATALVSHVYALAAKHGLDLTDFDAMSTLPAGYLANTATAMNAISVEDDLTAEAVQTALDEAIAADMAGIFAAATQTEADYNALYVATGLYYAVDFYTLNEYWDADGAKLAEVSTLEALYFNAAGGSNNNNTTWLAQFQRNDGSHDVHAYSPPYKPTANCGTTCVSAHHDHTATGDFQRVPFTPKAGYVSFARPLTYLNNSEPIKNQLDQHYLEMGKFGSTLPEAVTHQVIFKPNSITNNNFMQLYGTGFYVRNDADAIAVTKIGASSNPALTVEPTILKGKVNDFTFSYNKNGGNNTYGISVNGAAYSTTDIASPTVNQNNLLGFSSSTDMDLYAMRSYDHVLSVDEIAQNHFADLAKYFRLNVNGFENLDGETKKAVYAAFASLDLATATRNEAQAIYLDATIPAMKAIYEEKLMDNPNAEQLRQNELWLVAAEYFLDIATVEQVVTAERTMTYVYDTVTMANLAGKSNAQAQDFLVATANDAYYYESYRIADDTARDAFLDLAKANQLSIEEAMAIPAKALAPLYAACNTGMSKEELQAAVDAQVAAILAAEYPATSEAWTAEQYNALYVANGRYILTDFYTLNEYWDPEGTKLAEVSTEEAMKITDEASKTAWFDRFSVTDGTHQLYAYTPSKCANGTDCEKMENWLDHTGEFQVLGVVPNKGYVTLKGLNANQYVAFHGFGNPGGSVDNMPESLAYEVVFKHNTNTVNGFIQLFGQAMYTYTDTTNQKLFFTSVAGASAAFTDPEFVSFNEVGRFQFGYTKNNGTNTFSVSVNGSAPKTTDIAAPAANNNNFIGWNNASDLMLFALRAYDHVLSVEEMRQNHFADLAKYFRLDMTALELLTAEQKQALYTAMLNVNIEQGLETVEAAYRAAVTQLLYSSLEDGKMKEILSVVQADPAIVTALPAARLAEMEAAFAETDFAYATSVQVLRAIWKETLYSFWTFEEETAPTFTQEQYNAIYVHQDRMIYWVDFFTADASYQQYLDPYNFNGTETAYTQKYYKPGEELPFVKAGWLGMRNEGNGAGGYHPSERIFGNGYISLNIPIYSNLSFDAITRPGDATGLDTKLLRTNDQTYEFVFSNMTGNVASSFMLDSIRLNVGAPGGEFALKAPFEFRHYIKEDGTFGITYLQNADVEQMTFGSAAEGHTIHVTLDNTFNPYQVNYYLTFKDDTTGKYSELQRITKEQAESFASTIDLKKTDQLAPVDGTEAFAASGLAQEGKTPYVHAYQSYADIHYEIGADLKSYTSGDIYSQGYRTDSLGSGLTMNLHAIRRYDIVLTQDELEQNHFADLCKFYGLDLTPYNRMSEAQKQIVYDGMAAYQVAGNADVVKAAYVAAVNTAFYAAIADADIQAFIEKANIIGLSVEEVMNLSATQIAAVITAWDGLAASRTADSKYLLRGLLSDKLADYAIDVQLANLIKFLGFQAKIDDNVAATADYAGIRALFAFDKEILAALEERGLTVTFEVVAEMLDGEGQLLDGTVPVVKSVYNGTGFVGGYYEKSPLIAYDYFVLATNYKTASDLEKVGNDIRYSVRVTASGEGVNLSLTVAANSARYGDTVNAKEIYENLLTSGAEHDEIVRDVVNIGKAEGEQYKEIAVGDSFLDEYTIAYTHHYDKAAAIALRDGIKALTGVELKVVQAGILKDHTKDANLIYFAAANDAALEGMATAAYKFNTDTGSLVIGVADYSTATDFVTVLLTQIENLVTDGTLQNAPAAE